MKKATVEYVMPNTAGGRYIQPHPRKLSRVIDKQEYFCFPSEIISKATCGALVTARIKLFPLSRMHAVISFCTYMFSPTILHLIFIFALIPERTVVDHTNPYVKGRRDRHLLWGPSRHVFTYRPFKCGTVSETLLRFKFQASCPYIVSEVLNGLGLGLSTLGYL